MDIIDAIMKSKAGGAYRYVGEGRALLEVQKIHIVETRLEAKLFTIEFIKISGEMRCSKSKVELDDGVTVSWTGNLKEDSTPGNVKSFFMALLNVTEKELNGEKSTIVEALGKDQPAKGRHIVAEGVPIITKDGNPFTAINWFHPEE